MEVVAIACIITLAILVAIIVIVIAVLLYNQMLATNEVNKRLLLITKESIDKERSTQEELNNALVELERAADNQVSNKPEQENSGNDEDVFNPHEFMDNLE